MSLEQIRKDIDAIDRELVPLLQRRMTCSIKVAETKRAENIPVLDASREEAILDKVRSMDELYGNYTADIYRAIMDVSKQLQHDILGGSSALLNDIMSAGRVINSAHEGKVACQGVAGAFSQTACRQLFPRADIGFLPEFADVFSAVESGEAEYGILPVENSNAGSVPEVYDLLLKYRHYIIGGVDLKISQNLLGLPGAGISDIKEVLSHPQGLAQSAGFIESHGFKATESTNTAVAAMTVSQLNDKSKAAIGSTSAAAEYGLSVIAENIQGSEHNSTRFIAISKKLIIADDSNKVSLVFSLPHVTGSLYRVLNRFATHGLNLTKIESRMASSGDFNYLFYLDFTGNVRDISTVKLICDMSKELPEFTFLGNYKEIPAK